jgi:lipopolysaccharide export system protein LptA
MRRLFVLAGIVVPCAAAAQQRPAPAQSCNLVMENYDSTTTLSIKMPSGQYNTFTGRGVRGRCSNTDQRLAGDSLEAIGDTKSYTLIGNAHYTERRMKLDADRIYYYQAEERVVAEGNVVATTDKGTRLRGPRAEYFRAIPGSRPLSRLVATGRPVTRLSPDDAGSAAKDTVEMVADNVVTVGDSVVYAGGSVVITRPDLKAVSDSAIMDSGKEWSRLVGRPRVDGVGESKFTLVGKVIDLWSKQKKLERVLSSDSAKATNDDVTLASDTIDLRLKDQQLERAYAWGRSRARAHTADRDVVADSIDILMPGQLIRELRALRGASAASKTDSTKFISTENDWLKGDTIIATFDSTKAKGDSASKPAIKNILASGSASSFYQVPSSQGAKAAPNMNYVKGKAISVSFGADHSVGTVTVREQASGVYLELLPADSVAKDSTKTRKPADTKGKTPAKPASKTPTTPAKPAALTTGIKP